MLCLNTSTILIAINFKLSDRQPRASSQLTGCIGLAAAAAPADGHSFGDNQGQTPCVRVVPQLHCVCVQLSKVERHCQSSVKALSNLSIFAVIPKLRQEMHKCFSKSFYHML